MSNNCSAFYWHGSLERACSRCDHGAEYVATVVADNPRGCVHERAMTYFLCERHAKVFAKSHGVDFNAHRRFKTEREERLGR